jgi:hypothetical protein
MKKELYVFLVIFIFLTIGFHFAQWLDHPFEHLSSLPNSASYGFGWEHPFVYTLILYIFIGLPRLLFRKT